MQMLLKQLQIPYLFFDAVWTNHDLSNPVFIDQDRYFRYNNKPTTYWEQYYNHVWDKSDRWANHAPASYHAEWASHLITHIESNKLLSYQWTS